MKAYLWLLAASLLILLVGCGGAGGMGAHSNVSHPAADQSQNPTVWFFGDQVTAGWTFTNPMWINKAKVGQTSTETLEAMEVALQESHPNVVHVVVGNEDAILSPNNDAPDTIANLQAMVQLAKAAGVFIVVGSTAPGEQGDPSDPTPGVDVPLDYTNTWIGQNLQGVAGVAVVDYLLPLTGGMDLPVGEYGACTEFAFCGYSPDYSADGLVPNAAGYQLMTGLAEVAIQSCECGGTK